MCYNITIMKKVLGVLALALVACGLVVWLLLSRQTPIPQYATVEAIESRYAAQLDRLRELAQSPPSDLNGKISPKRQQELIEKHRGNPTLFSPPEILSAETFHHLKPRGGGVGRVLKLCSPSFRKMQLKSVSSQSIGNPLLSIGNGELTNGLVLEIVKYEVIMMHPSGHKVSYKMLLDLQKLKRAVQSDGMATGKHLQPVKVSEGYVISGTVLD